MLCHLGDLELGDAGMSQISSNRSNGIVNCIMYMSCRVYDTQGDIYCKMNQTMDYEHVRTIPSLGNLLAERTQCKLLVTRPSSSCWRGVLPVGYDP